MDLILTHDNADFDAAASQLAAHKLIPSARPVLPARLNRNVRHFTQLYWDELPYLTIDDLPRREAVARVVVVDTQTVQTMRGMDDSTRVTIIDHHDPRPHLDPAAELSLEQTGACATILVERIRADHIPLTPIEATLLLLGIYEDTGALTYATTTPRDAYVAAWLLDRGALLDVVQDFLNHPLSDGQQELYDRLLEAAETHDIEGYPVVVAAAAAPDVEEEIATLAHKLRDLLDPAAIFVLVALPHHIQMVARSTSDAFHVGHIAEHFDGGGHARAAAAILREIGLDEAKRRLLDVLPDFVRPPATVRDLMSRGVQTLPPDARARDASARMRRYGYEGFPVVEDGQVVGLLTRRHVDRAIDHGLEGITVDRIMDAGSTTVHPTDSIGTLQQVMMTTGWGQIPVVDDEKEIIGVVTRTDLINHLGHTAEAASAPAPVQRRAALPRDRVIALVDATLHPTVAALLRAIGRIAAEAGCTTYIVGGTVRDILLGAPTIDIDIVVEGDAIRLTRTLARRFGGETRSHARFGTGKWLLDPAAWSSLASELGAVHSSPTAHESDSTEAPLRDTERGMAERSSDRGEVQSVSAAPASTTHTTRAAASPLQTGEGWTDRRSGRGEVDSATLPTHIDFATARTEFYDAPAFLPEVERSSIKHDLHRRDFTINTLAMRLDPRHFGQLLDFYGGVQDLHDGVIRVLHSLSFYDDPTRILRAVRYEQRFGFHIEPRTRELIADAVPLVDRLSSDRVKHELERIFDEARPEDHLRRLADFDVLARIHPALPADAWLTSAYRALRFAASVPLWPELPAVDLELPYFALLTFRLTRPQMHLVCDRLHVRRRTVDTLDAVHDLREHLPTLAEDLAPSGIDRLLQPGSRVSQADDVLVALWAAAPTYAARAHIVDYAAHLRHLSPTITGDDLKQRGLPPGPEYSAILSDLRAGWLDGEITTPAEEQARLDHLIAHHFPEATS